MVTNRDEKWYYGMPSQGSSKKGTETTRAQVAPGFVLDQDLTILEFLGNTAPYVEFATGVASLQLRNVVHPSLRRSVAETAEKALDTGAPVRGRGVRFYREGVPRTVRVSAAPTPHPETGGACVEIRFEETAARNAPSKRAVASPQPVSVGGPEKNLGEEVYRLQGQLEEAALAREEAPGSFASRLRTIEEEKEKFLAELEHAYAELEAHHKELQTLISEREETELQLRGQRDFIEAVLDTAHALVMVVDRQGRIVRFNAACERAAGRELQRMRSGPFLDLIPAVQRDYVRGVFEELVSGRFPNQCENDWVRKDGTRIQIAWSNTALTNAAGVVTHVVGVGVDVTEQRKAEAALRDSEARNRALVEAAPLGIVAIDGEGRIQTINTGLERMFGYERAELTGQPLQILLPKRFRRAHHKHERHFFQHPMNRPMGTGMALFGRHKEGREFPIEVGLGHFQAAGGSYAVAFVTDVTEKVRTQQTIERDRDEIRELASRLITVQEDEQSRIARELHDGLVQELVALKLDLALLARRAQTAKLDLLDDLLHAAAETGQLAEGARAISHELHPSALEQLGLAPALRANAAQVRRSKGVDVQVLQKDPIPPLLSNVALGLYRIAQEALWNATNHSGSDSVKIALRTEGGRLTLEVIDSGKGFDLAQARSGDRHSLGLLSMEERARLIHADLDIDSRPGKGTIVRVIVNLEKAG